MAVRSSSALAALGTAVPSFGSIIGSRDKYQGGGVSRHQPSWREASMETTDILKASGQCVELVSHNVCEPSTVPADPLL